MNNSGRKSIKVAIVGNPNSGKSTIFNALTGLNQKTGNFPGVTVDKKSGLIKLSDDTDAELIDLPGTYSLYPKSLDERVACDVLCDKNNDDYPDITLIVADASNLKRSLFLASQIIDLKRPTLLVLNMMDLMEKKGGIIDFVKLSEELGVKVIGVSARSGQHLSDIRQVLAAFPEAAQKTFIDQSATADISAQTQETVDRYKKISRIVNNCVTQQALTDHNTVTRRLDKVLTHRVWGYIIFLSVLFLIFEALFFLAAFPTEWIEKAFGALTDYASTHLPEGELSDLFVNGILAGLGGIIVFVPQIALLFAFIAILEDTGYMARVSFIMDRLMRKFGLNGRSVIPLISGTACAIPAIMSTRTISNWKERMITIMVTPLMSCSARLPVYTLLISLIATEDSGFFNFQGIILMGLYLIGFLAAIGAAFVMKKMLKTTEKSYFIMELPVYRSPQWKTVGFTVLDKVKIFLFDAGKIILAISIVLWFLASHAPANKFDAIEAKYSSSVISDSLNPEEVKQKIASEKLEASYAGMVGKSIEPIIAPLGFDWKIGIALVTSFAAREVFVGTMSTIYSVGDADNTKSIGEKMRAEINPKTGKLKFTKAMGFSLLLFYAFAMQCMSTLAVVYHETKNWKWPMLQFLYMSALAYLSSLLVYQIIG